MKKQNQNQSTYNILKKAFNEKVDLKITKLEAILIQFVRADLSDKSINQCITLLKQIKDKKNERKNNCID